MRGSIANSTPILRRGQPHGVRLLRSPVMFTYSFYFLILRPDKLETEHLGPQQGEDSTELE